jgi:hypothetical protein
MHSPKEKELGALLPTKRANRYFNLHSTFIFSSLIAIILFNLDDM